VALKGEQASSRFIPWPSSLTRISAAARLDLDAMRFAGIQRILQQLLHHRGWTIHHLAAAIWLAT